MERAILHSDLNSFYASVEMITCYKMMTIRHPNEKGKARKFEFLAEGMKEWWIKLAEGTGTTEDFLDWLSQF